MSITIALPSGFSFMLQDSLFDDLLAGRGLNGIICVIIRLGEGIFSLNLS